MFRRIAGQQGVPLRDRRAPAVQGRRHVGCPRNVGRQLPRLFGIEFHGFERVQKLLLQRSLAFDLHQRFVEAQQGAFDGLALPFQHVHLMGLAGIQQGLVGGFERVLLRRGLGFQPGDRRIGDFLVFRAGARFGARGVGVAGLHGEIRLAAQAGHPHQPGAPHEGKAGAPRQPPGQFLVRDLLVRIQGPIARHDVGQQGLALEFFDLRVQRVLDLHHRRRIFDQGFLLVQDAGPAHAQLDDGAGLVEVRRLAQVESRGAQRERRRQDDRQPLLAHDPDQPQRIHGVERPGIRWRFAVIGARRRAAVVGRRRERRRQRGRRRVRNGGRGHGSVLPELAASAAGGAGGAPIRRRSGARQSVGNAASNAVHA